MSSETISAIAYRRHARISPICRSG